MTTEEIKDELYRMLSDVVNGGYPKRTYAQQARYKEAVKRTIDALDVLEEMSCSEKPNKWIPTSESMPPIGQDVLVCDLDGDMYITYLHLNGTWGFEYCGNKIKNVVAWQELPLPYEAGRDDESCDEI